MPLYEYTCLICGRQYEEFHHVDERNSSVCCQKTAQKLISKSQGKPVVLEYFSENANAHFTGPKQRERVLKDKNLVAIPEGIVKHF